MRPDFEPALSFRPWLIDERLSDEADSVPLTEAVVFYAMSLV